jgi:PadR family transcriptional regulator, regulatory protein AphA
MAVKTQDSMSDLTTTSYAILGLLALRDWTTYELAAQMKRTLDHVWPRAERGLYIEPKRLVAERVATSRKESTGRRQRTVYSITPAGREALREWLSSPLTPPSLEFEGMLRVLFADQGDFGQLRAALEAIDQQATVRRSQFATMASEMLAEGGGFPERLHVNALGMRYMIDHYDHISDWAQWARRTIDDWNDTRTPAQTWSEPARRILEDAAFGRRSPRYRTRRTR